MPELTHREFSRRGAEATNKLLTPETRRKAALESWAKIEQKARRIRALRATRTRRKGVGWPEKLTCGLCGGLGHNRRTCTDGQ